MPRSGGKKKSRSSSKPDHAYNPKQPPSVAKPVSEYTQNVQAEVQALFEKKFAFKRPIEGQVWALPLAKSLFIAPALKDWDPEMTGHKAELNDLKCELSDKDIRQWHQHTSFTHRAALVMPHLRNNYWAELCTQAWCKFYEIVSSYDVIQPGLAAEEGAHFNSVHLCEAPGAFVASLNHYIKSWSLGKHLTWNWLATTLNPYYEGNSTDTMIADDRFILQTRGHWFFGDDNTGDLMNVDNLMSLRQRVEATMGTVHLVTADGSINCQNDPAEQEIVVSQLHYCEVVTAMALLATGGSFILKMFTLFEHQTACLMYLLNCTFQQVHVCKPATSKAGNSEVYVVCLGYTGIQNVTEHMPNLCSHFGPTECPKALFPASDIPASFLSQLRTCAATFKRYQMTTISENIWLYPQMSQEERHRLTQVRECCCQAYVEHYAIRSIRKADKICSDSSKERNTRASVGMFAKTATKRLQGTFMERQQLDHGPWLQQLSADYQQLAVATSGSDVITQILQNNRKLIPSEVATWDVTIGKRLTLIQSSSFCVAEVLDDWNLASKHSQIGCAVGEKGLKEPTSCDQALVDLMLADLANQHKISRTDGAINCMCLLTQSRDDDGFLKLLKSTGHWSLKDCLVKTTPAKVTVAMKDRGQTIDDNDDDSGSSIPPSPINNSHLTDNAVITKCCEVLHDCKVPMVYSDCSLAREVSHDRVPGLSELDTRLQSLVSVIIAMHALHIGGTLIVCIPGILTRFTAGLLYCIHKTFQQVNLVAAPDGSGTNGIAIVAQRFVGAHRALIQHLRNVHNSILESKSKRETDVLQFVHQSYLCEKHFNSAVTSFNEKLLTAQTIAHVQAELITQLDKEQMDGHTTEQNR